MEEKNYEAIVEAILFTMGESVELEKIAAALELDKKETKKIIEHLMKEYEKPSIGMKIIELDEQKKRIVCSRRAVVKEENEARKAEAWSKLAEGEVVKGIVRRLTDFGAFVDLGGVDGLIHISQIADRRIDKPSDVLSEGQMVDAKITAIDEEKKKISLSIRALLSGEEEAPVEE